MHWMLKIVFFGILCTGNVVFGANILVLEGLASPSHHIFFRVINEALAARGHNVTSISADVEINPVANLTYLHNEMVYAELYKGYEDVDNMNLLDFGYDGNLATIFEVEEYYLNTLAGIKKSTGYKQLLAYPDDFKFDLVIYDYMGLPTILGFLHKFKNPPLIGVTAFHAVSPTINLVGSSFNPSYIPFYFGSGLKETFFGRVENFFLCFFDYFHKYYVVFPKIYSVVKDDFPGLPDLTELERQTRLTLINYSPAIHDLEPMLPNVIPIAGMHVQKVKSLPKEFQEILDNAKNGLILFSLGTNVKSWMLGDERIQKFIEAFRNLPQYTILWKFDNEKIPNVPSNVIIKRWMPQNDILAHRNTKLFISHCGLLSSLESTWHGVPILGVPIFLDQFTNSETLIKAGISESINVRSFTSAEVTDVIVKMMTSTKYRNNARTKSRLFQDQPQTPLERGLWWIEFVLRNPDVGLIRSKSMDLNVLTLHNIDVIVFYVIMILSILYLIIKIVQFLFGERKFSRQLKKQKLN
ncbi:UDP-glucosyltransferase 2-like [Phlebotomus papatasi]|uniref:UDP-glucosyltransferase 2-like n=1 Tax=Phlebotomus papatasi TaxID=29031 RepID=UPI0024832FAB|nr:UDP-glucosyltransferase 2-like [Phlebotomus papatasi]